MPKKTKTKNKVDIVRVEDVDIEITEKSNSIKASFAKNGKMFSREIPLDNISDKEKIKKEIIRRANIFLSDDFIPKLIKIVNRNVTSLEGKKRNEKVVNKIYGWV